MALGSIQPLKQMSTRNIPYGRSPAAIVGSNPTGDMDVSVVCVVCCQFEVSATSVVYILTYVRQR
jgi:hypothetical protein